MSSSTAPAALRDTLRPDVTRRRLPSAVLPVAFVVLWSSGFVGAEIGTRVTTADTLLMWRMLVAALLLLAFCAATGRRLTGAALRRHVPLGLLMQFGYLAGVFHGVEAGVSGATVALIAAVQPVLVAVVAIVALREPLSRRAALGLALGFGGVALVVGDGLGAGSAPAWAYLLPVAAMLFLSVGTVCQQRTPDPVDLVTGLTVQTVVAAVGFSVLAAFAGDAAPPASWSFVGAVAWVVIAAGFGGYGTYLLVLKTRGAATVSALLYLTPPTTAVWTTVMFGDPLRGTAVAGMALSLVGVLLFLRFRVGAPRVSLDS